VTTSIRPVRQTAFDRTLRGADDATGMVRIWPRRNQRRAAGALTARISGSDIDLLKAALLDGDAALQAYRAWRLTLDLATISYGQQRMLPLLQQNLTRLHIDDPHIERFRGVRRYYWVRNLRALALVRPIFAALDQNRIPFLVLKGAALIAAYLDDRSLRPMDDVDILVADEHVASAVRTLITAGLTPPGLDPGLIDHQRLRTELPAWPFHGADVNLDLHWRAMHLDRRPHADDRFWRDSRTVSLGGIPIRTLDPAHHLLHIFAHAAQDFAGTANQQWPADAAMLIRGSSDLSWQRLVQEAGTRRMSAIAADGLNFLARELNLPVPMAVIRELAAATRPSERMEARLRGAGPRTTLGRPAQLLLDLQDFRRGDRKYLDRSAIRSVPAFLRTRTGLKTIWPVPLIACEAMFGHPAWLRRVARRDWYRKLPDAHRLPGLGEEIKVKGLPADEAALVSGWGLPEPTGRWTVGREATVAWRVAREANDLDLLIDGYAFLHEAAPSLDVEVWADDRLNATLHFQRGVTQPQPARIRLRRPRANRGILFVSLLVRAPRSPAALGLSGDQRALGIHVQKLGLVAAGGQLRVARERLPRLGDTLKLAGGPMEEAAVLYGWGAAEPIGRWTVGTEAVIAWCIGDSDADLTLVCDGDAFLPPEAPHQDVDVWANDQLATSWHFAADAQSPLPARVPLPRTASAKLLFLTFRVRSPRSPLELGLGGDWRGLGLLMRSLTVVQN
jgi:hypothetical protein